MNEVPTSVYWCIAIFGIIEAILGVLIVAFLMSHDENSRRKYESKEN